MSDQNSDTQACYAGNPHEYDEIKCSVCGATKAIGIAEHLLDEIERVQAALARVGTDVWRETLANTEQVERARRGHQQIASGRFKVVHVQSRDTKDCLKHGATPQPPVSEDERDPMCTCEGTKATLGDDWFDFGNVKRMLVEGKPLGVHVQKRMADEIEYLRKREAYLVAELNACTHVPSGDKDGLE